MLSETEMEGRRIFSSFSILAKSPNSFKSAQSIWKEYSRISNSFSNQFSSDFSANNVNEISLSNSDSVSYGISTVKSIKMKPETENELLNRLANLNQVLEMKQEEASDQVSLSDLFIH